MTHRPALHRVHPRLVLAALAATFLLAVAAAALAAPPAPATPPPPAGHYCNMGYFTPETLARHKVLVPRVAAAVTRVRPLPDGYEYTLKGSMPELGEFLDGTRGCCPTVEYAVTFRPHRGTVVLRITGGPGAKAFIREEFNVISHPRG
jgi:hypothetical protein